MNKAILTFSTAWQRTSVGECIELESWRAIVDLSIAQVTYHILLTIQGCVAVVCGRRGILVHVDIFAESYKNTCFDYTLLVICKDR